VLAALVGLALPALSVAAVINGTPDPDFMDGTPQADVIDGKGGDDTMMGLAGDDVYFVRQAGDEVIEGAGEGTDTIKAAVTFALPIFVENLTLLGLDAFNATGNELANRLVGNPADNTLNGRGGAHTMLGNAGSDTYIVNSPADVVVESAGEGSDLVRSSASYVLRAHVEKLVLIGNGAINGTGNDLGNAVTGNAGSNSLNGKAGDDTVNGAGGNDRLSGGAGNDTLTGGPGADTFQFDAPLDFSTNVDRVVDFVPAVDAIRLIGTVFSALTTAGALPAAAFRRGGGAADPSDRILYDTGQGIVQYDADGTGPIHAVRFARLPAGLAVTHADFVVIDPVGPPVNYATQIQPIFTLNCINCHSGPTAPKGLRLDSQNSYANLVDVASTEVPSLKRVKPEDDTNSYLVQKVDGTAAEGSRMPLASPALSFADRALIRQWVVEGANP
jgi:Ca2+-binding RTX toxin-like protein